MPVGHNPFPAMPPIHGIKLGTANAGIKQTVRDDLLLIEIAEDASCAAVFTRNAFCAAPVLVARDHLKNRPRWLIVNSGNANAGTGLQGYEDAKATCREVAVETGGKAQQVLPFSTGVIGQPLRVDKIKAAIPAAYEALHEKHWDKAARAIMTTDTFPKGVSVKVNLGGEPVTINGITKGAGMIQPDMATMLAFLATDAKVNNTLLQECLLAAVKQSFNLITVDGDTSTNDSCVLLASGASNAPEITADSEFYPPFAEAVLSACKQLAELIVRDGEGATKLMRIVVKNALNKEEAARVGKTIAHSPLVKTAFFASDPNWGRILAAVGRAGVDNMVLENIEIYLGEVCIVRNGGVADDYTEAAGQEVMNREEIVVTVNLGRGQALQEVLTCDFSYDYVKINAEYRT